MIYIIYVCLCTLWAEKHTQHVGIPCCFGQFWLLVSYFSKGQILEPTSTVVTWEAFWICSWIEAPEPMMPAGYLKKAGVGLIRQDVDFADGFYIAGFICLSMLIHNFTLLWMFFHFHQLMIGPLGKWGN